jgi:SAM-dependent methyltransferase
MTISAGNTKLLTESPPQNSYIPGIDVAAYISLVEKRFSRLAGALWFDREGAAEAIDELCRSVNEFETNDAGRGESYRRAQRDRLVRAHGIRSLFRLAADVADVSEIPAGWTALDLLGGDGLLADVLGATAPQTRGSIITSDMASHMVLEALRAGLPAIRQQAKFLFLHDEVADAALIAYGSHHIPRAQRAAVCAEATRVLCPGGRLVLHDFEEGSPVTRWFTEVVHHYSRAGHDYDHFTLAEMRGYLSQADLDVVWADRMYDPLLMSGDSAAEAVAHCVDYLVAMYGLDYLVSAAPRQELQSTVWNLAQRCFSYDPGDVPAGRPARPAVYRADGRWVAEVPRVALVAVGQKSLRWQSPRNAAPSWMPTARDGSCRPR